MYAIRSYYEIRALLWREGVLVAEEQGTLKETFYTPQEIERKNEGRVSFRQVGDAHKHQLQILFETYQPGADTGRTMLKHESQEGGIVISGRMELTVEDHKYILGPGDSYLFDSRLPHRFRNPFDETCTLVSACTPPYL